MIKQQSKPFAFPSSVFFIGIGGIEVSALAKLALYEGARVAGTDLLESGITRELRNFGAEVTIAKTIESISLLAYKPKLIIYSLAVSPEHQLLRQAKKLRIKKVYKLTNKISFLSAFSYAQYVFCKSCNISFYWK